MLQFLCAMFPAIQAVAVLPASFGCYKTQTGTGTLTALHDTTQKHIHCSSCSTSCLLASQDTIKSKLKLGHSVHTMTQLRTHSFIIYSRISMRSLSKAGYVSLELYLEEPTNHSWHYIQTPKLSMAHVRWKCRHYKFKWWFFHLTMKKKLKQESCLTAILCS